MLPRLALGMTYGDGRGDASGEPRSSARRNGARRMTSRGGIGVREVLEQEGVLGEVVRCEDVVNEVEQIVVGDVFVVRDAGDLEHA